MLDRSKHHAGQSERATRRAPGRREELVAAALAVIGRLGASASMEEMAAEAGITKPVLYRYFGDRDGVVRAVAESFADRLVARLDEALSSGRADPPSSTIRAAIEAYVSFIEEDPSLYSYLTQHAPADSPATMAVVERVAAPIEKVLAARLLEAGREAAPARTWAASVVGAVHMAGARWAGSRQVDRSVLVDELAQFVSYGLVGQPERLQQFG